MLVRKRLVTKDEVLEEVKVVRRELERKRARQAPSLLPCPLTSFPYKSSIPPGSPLFAVGLG